MVRMNAIGGTLPELPLESFVSAAPQDFNPHSRQNITFGKCCDNFYTHRRRKKSKFSVAKNSQWYSSVHHERVKIAQLSTVLQSFYKNFWNPKVLRKWGLVWLSMEEMRGRTSFAQNNLWIYQQLEEGCGICPHSCVFLLGFLSAGNGKYSLEVWNDWKNVSCWVHFRF